MSEKLSGKKKLYKMTSTSGKLQATRTTVALPSLDSKLLIAASELKRRANQWLISKPQKSKNYNGSFLWIRLRPPMSQLLATDIERGLTSTVPLVELPPCLAHVVQTEELFRQQFQPKMVVDANDNSNIAFFRALEDLRVSLGAKLAQSIRKGKRSSVLSKNVFENLGLPIIDSKGVRKPYPYIKPIQPLPQQQQATGEDEDEDEEEDPDFKRRSAFLKISSDCIIKKTTLEQGQPRVITANAHKIIKKHGLGTTIVAIAISVRYAFLKPPSALKGTTGNKTWPLTLHLEVEQIKVLPNVSSIVSVPLSKKSPQLEGKKMSLVRATTPSTESETTSNNNLIVIKSPQPGGKKMSLVRAAASEADTVDLDDSEDEEEEEEEEEVEEVEEVEEEEEDANEQGAGDSWSMEVNPTEEEEEEEEEEDDDDDDDEDDNDKEVEEEEEEEEVDEEEHVEHVEIPPTKMNIIIQEAAQDFEQPSAAETVPASEKKKKRVHEEAPSTSEYVVYQNQEQHLNEHPKEWLAMEKMMNPSPYKKQKLTAEVKEKKKKKMVVVAPKQKQPPTMRKGELLRNSAYRYIVAQLQVEAPHVLEQKTELGEKLSCISAVWDKMPLFEVIKEAGLAGQITSTVAQRLLKIKQNDVQTMVLRMTTGLAVPHGTMKAMKQTTIEEIVQGPSAEEDRAAVATILN